jgi:hypothetical protein
MMIRRAGLACLSVLFVVAGCDVVAPTNPFDPSTNPEEQARASVSGRIILEDTITLAETLRTQLERLEVGIVDAAGDPVVGGNGAPVVAALVLDDGLPNVASFSLTNLVPGRYRLTVDNVPSRFAPITLAPFTVGAGDDFDVGDLRFSLAAVDGGGPGTISGVARLEGGVGGPRRVDLYVLDGERPVLLASRVSEDDGAFSFGALQVGRYAVVSSLTGFTTAYSLDLNIDDQSEGGTAVALVGGAAPVLVPITAVIRPSVADERVILDDGQLYTSADSIPLDVLAFGGVTGMRLSTNPTFAGATQPFVTHSASAEITLPVENGVVVDGTIEIFAQFEARSSLGFVFSSDVFSTRIIHDATPPEVLALSSPQVQASADGTRFITNRNGTPFLVVEATDLHSAVDGVLVLQPADNAEPNAATFIDAFTDVSSNGGVARVTVPLPLSAGDGEKVVYAFVVDRAGNISDAAPITFVVDRTPPAAAIVVDNLVGDAVKVRSAVIRFVLEGGEETPASVQIGQTPMLPSSPVLGFDDVITVPLSGQHDQTVTVTARLIDRAGNDVTLTSAPIRLDLVSDVTGRVVVEGVPGLPADHTAAVSVVSSDGTVVASGASGADGTFVLPRVPETSGATLVVQRAGYRAVQSLLPNLVPGGVVTLPPIELRLGRGDATGVAQRGDRADDATAHGGIAVSVSLTGSTRRIVATTVTGPDGSFTFADLPATITGERYTVVAEAADYARATVDGGVEVAIDDIALVNDGAPIFLQPISGDFDLCAPTGVCSPLSFTNLESLRVKLRDEGNVDRIRVQGRTAFSAGDALPAFIDFNPAVPVLVNIDGADGVVSVFVQVESGGVAGPVLQASITLDNLPPNIVALTTTPSPLALDPSFTNRTTLRATIDADAGEGAVSPLDTPRARFSDVPPSCPIVGGKACPSGVSCDVAFPTVGGVIAEEEHELFFCACDLAGNCADPISTSVIVDRTPPRVAHGIGAQPISPFIVTRNGTHFTRSGSYQVRVAVGTARDAGGAAVVDLDGAPIADAFGFRFATNPSLSGVNIAPFGERPAPGSNVDVGGPALPAVDGTYVITGQLVDAAGNTTALDPSPLSFSLTLDSAPPPVSFTLNGGAASTQNATVTLDIQSGAGADSAVEVLLATDGGQFQTGTQLRSLPLVAPNNTFVLTTTPPPGGDGDFTVFGRFADAAGNITDRFDSIRLDRTGPQMLTLSCADCVVRDGQNFLADSDRSALFDVNAQDALGTVTELEIRVNALAPIRAPFTGSVAVVLPNTDGPHTVRVAAIDDAGNVGAPLQSVVRLDRAAPTVSLRVDAGTALAVGGNVTVGITAADATGTVSTMRTSTTGTFSGPQQAFTPLLSLPVQAGTTTIAVEVFDEAGNRATAQATPPVGVVSIAAGAVATTSNVVNVGITHSTTTTGIALSSTLPDCRSATYVATAPNSASTTRSFTLPTGDGEKTIFACIKDGAGAVINNTSLAADTIILDATPPVGGAVFINANAPATTSANVTLTIAAPSDAPEMFISTAASVDCATATPYIASAPTAAVVLPTGTAPQDGLRTVSVCFKDVAGNTALVTDSILLDRFAPTGSVVIAQGAAFATSPIVNVDITADSDVVQMALSTAALSCASANYQALQGSVSLTLGGGDGPKTVRVCLKDSAGQFTATALSDDIVLDTTRPSATFTLASGAAGIASATVPFAFVGASTDVATMKIANDAVDCANPAGYIAFVASGTHAVTAGDGTKTVVACLRDAAQLTTLFSSSIVVDTTAPVGSIAIAGGAAFITSAANVSVNLAASDGAGVGAISMKVQESATPINCAVAAGYESFNSTKVLTLSGGDGTKTVQACFRDGLNNATAVSIADTAVLDTQNPSATLQVNGGASAVASRDVTLNLVGASSDVVAMALQNGSTLDCASALFQPFSASSALTLTAGDGSKSIIGCLRDAAGRTANVSTTVTLDTLPPTAALALTVPASGVTNGTSVTVQLTGEASTSFAIVAGALDCANATYTTGFTGTQNRALTIGGVDGSKQLSACLRDAAGNTTAASTSVVLDRTVPVAFTLACSNCPLVGTTSFTPSTSTLFNVFATDEGGVATVDFTVVAPSGASSTLANVPFQNQLPVALASGDGVYNISARFKDAAGNNSNTLGPVQVTLDTVLPAVTPTLAGRPNGSSTVTATEVVDVTLAGIANDFSRVRTGNDAAFTGSAITSAVPGTTVQHVLTTGDGGKTVFIQVFDNAGNASGIVQRSITLDATPPSSALVSVAGGAALINTLSSTVRVAANGATSVDIESVDSSGGLIDRVTINAFDGDETVNMDIADDSGFFFVLATFRDNAGHTVEQTVSVEVDIDVPAAPKVSIDDDAPFSVSGVVNVVVTSEESDVTAMQIAVDGTADTEPFVPFAVSTTAVLQAGDCAVLGCKRVEVRVRDAAGNVSAAAADTITRDGTAPTAPRINNESIVTRAPTVTVSLAQLSTDVFSPVVHQIIGGGISAFTTMTSTAGHVVSLPVDGVFNIRVRGTDPAGNASAEDTVTIRRDTVPPPPPTNVRNTNRNGEVLIEWTPVPQSQASDVAGYRVWYGDDGSFTLPELDGAFATQGRSPIDVGNVNAITLSGLPNNSSTNIMVTAYDRTGNGLDGSVCVPSVALCAPGLESAPSNLVTALPNEVTPLRLNTIALTGSDLFRSVAASVNGTRLYTMGQSGGSNTIQVIDVSNPAQMTVLGTLAMTGGTLANGPLEPWGNFLYVPTDTTGVSGIRIVNIGNPRSVTSAGSTANVVVAPNVREYVALRGTGRFFYGVVRRQTTAVSRPALVKLEASTNLGSGALTERAIVDISTTVGGPIISLDANARTVVVGRSDEGVFIFSTNPNSTAAPTLLASRTDFGGSVRDVELSGNRVFVGVDSGGTQGSTNGLVVLSTFGTKLGSLGGFNCTNVEVIPGYALCNDNQSGAQNELIIIDISDLGSMRIAGRLLINPSEGGIGNAVVVAQNMAYVTRRDGQLDAVELASPGRVNIRAGDGTTNDFIKLRGRFAYAAGNANNDGFRIYDLLNLDDPGLVGSLSPAQLGCAGSSACIPLGMDIDQSGSYAVVIFRTGTFSRNIFAIDITGNPTILNPSGDVRDIFGAETSISHELVSIHGNAVHFAGTSGLTTDVGGSPQEFCSDCVSTHRLFPNNVAGDNPLVSANVGVVFGSDSAVALTQQDGFLAVLEGGLGSELHIIDAEPASTLTLRQTLGGTANTVGSVGRHLYTRGDVIYVSSGGAGGNNQKLRVVSAPVATNGNVTMSLLAAAGRNEETGAIAPAGRFLITPNTAQSCTVDGFRAFQITSTSETPLVLSNRVIPCARTMDMLGTTLVAGGRTQFSGSQPGFQILSVSP